MEPKTFREVRSDYNRFLVFVERKVDAIGQKGFGNGETRVSGTMKRSQVSIIKVLRLGKPLGRDSPEEENPMALFPCRYKRVVAKYEIIGRRFFQ